jgi:hypothetical protein
MNMREISSVRRTYRRPNKLKQPNKSFLKKYRLTSMVAVIVALAGIFSLLFLGVSHATAPGSPIKSGWSGYCLDDYRSKLVEGNQVDLWPCNNSAAQDWQVNLTQIIHDKDMCLTASSDTKITINSCNNGADQVWLRDDTSFLNPDKGLCLTAGSAEEDGQLTLTSCDRLTADSKSWTPNIDYSTYPCTGSQGQMVACYAIKEWVKWTSEPNNHEALLNEYTAGAPFEEWCADFVSYVYKEAGYPFNSGEYNGWDENIASNIVNQGFTVDSSSGYIPQPGDVAYFDYPGGHVEIVVSGGKTPTFIYGNSAIIDPTTGNGDMAANTTTNLPSLGQLEYYMSPNSST